MTSNVINNFIQVYLEANKDLIRTMVVKSNFAVRAINQQVIKEHGEFAVPIEDKTVWKYYMNVAGEYHFTDTPMYVISLDTKDEILFNKQNLKFHTATAEGYKVGTRFYLALVDKYPQQQFLINCILNPVDKTYAIEAEQGTILNYNSQLVEESETTLISELESFIKLYLARNYVEAFTLTDPYYGYIQWMLLSQQALLKLLNLRLKRCKTEEVHSFHLRQYLASHRGLDKYLPYLTREQALWLYRNIRYIERNAGKTSTFNKLIEIILDKQNIPLNELTLRLTSEFTQDGYAIPIARRKALAKQNVSQYATITLPEFFLLEQETAYGNKIFLDSHKEEITKKIANHPSSVIRTKDLESYMVDLGNSVPDPLPDVILRQWISMTHMGLYNISVNFKDPKTTIEYSLSSWDAIIYFLYITCHMEKIPFTRVPPTANVKYRWHPRPAVEDLTRLIEPGMEWMKPIAEDLVSAQPILTECTSVNQFFEMTYKVYEECLNHWFTMAETEDMYARGVMEQMILKLFGSCLRDFSNGEAAEDWRLRLNLPHYDMTYDEAQMLLSEIFSKATGYLVEETKSLRNIQRALLNLFEDLSSYSIQIIPEINDQDMILLSGAAHRVGNVMGVVEDVSRAYIEHHVLDANGYVEDALQARDELELNVATVTSIITNWGDVFAEIVAEAYVNQDIHEFSPMTRQSLDIRSFFTDPVTDIVYEVAVRTLDGYLTQDQLKELAQLEMYQ